MIRFSKTLLFTILILVNYGEILYSQIAGGEVQNAATVDLRQLQVDDLSDDQIRSLLRRVEASGYTERDLEKIALSRGMRPSEISKLRQRIKDINKDDEEFTKNLADTRVRGGGEDGSTDFSIDTDETTEEDNWLIRAMMVDPKAERVYGFHLFNNQNLTFEPVMNIAVPRGYIVGPGDEILIDLWGAVYENFRQQVTPDGVIVIEDIGAIQVSGLSIEEATRRIVGRLSNSYEGLKGPNPSIQSLVSLGELRSIKVTITGEVNMPGTYTLSSLSTVYTALYLSAGPNFNGSFRDIELIRGNKVIARIDVYDFLRKADLSGNITLMDQDIIKINPFKARVAVGGEIRRPALYEIKENEVLSDLISMAGGLTDNAYAHRVRIYRKTSREQAIIDVEQPEFTNFGLNNGDSLAIGPILKRFENRVTIEGAVYRPGEYSLDNDLTFVKLVGKAEGLKGDAFPTRATIYRTAQDYKLEIIPVNLSAIMGGQAPDIALKRDDLVRIPSIFDLEEEYTLQIDGEVKKPGSYPHVRQITLGDLIMAAGGLKESASLAKVEIARRIKDNEAIQSSNKIAEIFQYSIPANLELGSAAASFILEPFDRVFIRRSPGYETQRLVSVEGEVSFPGQYALTTKTERLSDLVARAGGLTPEAYLRGASLVRKQSFNAQQRARILRTANMEGKIETGEQGVEESIGIDLALIMKNAGTELDLILQEGDVLRIPKELQTVKLTGGFLYPVTVKYKGSKSLRYYASQAGGYSDKAMRRKTYVIYANGAVDRTRNYVLFRHYPRVEPGSEIILPVKPERAGFNPQFYGLLGTTISTLALITVTVINASK